MFKRIISLLLCACSSIALAQSLSVTATITDSDGTAWVNGTGSVQIYSPNGTPYYNGSAVSTALQTFTLNGSGALAVTLNNTNTITPVGAQYVWTLCSRTSATCSKFTTAVTAANMTSALSALVIAPRFSASYSSFGYADIEVTTVPFPGGTYYNVITPCTRQWTGSAWTCLGAGGGSTAPPAILASGGNFVSSGDSLCAGNGLSAGQDWPTLLGAMLGLTGSTVHNTCHSGLALAGMVADYTAEVHPLSPAVTTKPAILAISIYGNDIANIAIAGGGSCASSCTYATLADYETAYAAYLAGAISDGYKIMFMEQWAQTGRQAYDSIRLQFNEYNRTSTQVNYYLSTVQRMNLPTNTVMYQGDGLHETLIGSTEIAQMANLSLYSGGQHLGFGNSIFELSTQPYIIRTLALGVDAVRLTNLSITGYSSFGLYDHTGVRQASFGWANTSAGFQPGSMFFSTTTTAPINFCSNGACKLAVDSVQFGAQAGDGNTVITMYNGGSAANQMGLFAASGYNARMSTADQAGAKITLGYQNGTGLGNTRTYTDIVNFFHDSGLMQPLYGVEGPVSAPSGSCATSSPTGTSLAGSWVFSQDGHATFCSAGTWVTKI